MTISLQSNYNILMNKLRRLIPLVITAILLITNIYFYQDYHKLDQTNTMFLIAIIVSILSFMLKWLPHKPKIDKFIKVITILLVPLLIEMAVELCNNNLLSDIEGIGNVFVNYGIILLIAMILYALLASMKISFAITTVILCIFGIANMYVKQFKGIPLLPWDLSVIKTAAGVASNYQLTFNVQVLFTLTVINVIFALLFWLPKAQKTKQRILYRTTCLFLSAAILITFYGTDFFQVTLGATPDFFNQARGYENYGAIAEFFVNTRYLSLKKPHGYDVETLETQLKENINSTQTITETALGQRPNATVEHPNIITIMNEAFSDLQVIGKFETDKEYLSFENSMKDDKNTIQGNVYVSTIGTGTSNTEYEFLTGNSMAFLPIGSNAYTLYEKHTQPGFAMTLSDQNYSTTAFHPYYKENWNRVNTYQYMNFDRYIGIEDITNYQKLRNYISDEWDFQHIIDLYEQRDTAKPFFMFNVTMQNHSPYNTGLLRDVHITSMKGDYPQTEEYLSVIRRSDMALEQLVNYFKNVSEPTIILMYGDHQPFIEDEFYEELYGKPLHELSDAENQRRYITHFFMWANYDIPSGTIPYISANYLSTLLAENANVKLTPYQNFQQNIYQDVPVVSALGCIDKDGNYFVYGDENTHSNRLATYAQLAYNNLIEEEKRKNELFALLPTNSK